MTTQPDADWHQPPPAIDSGLPVTLQLLSTGAGVGVGCGVGIGLISPINLAAVPVIGQAVQGVSAGLSGASSLLGPLQAAGASARSAARGLGVPGLDVGAGCGVLAGYYFGAGVMIKPSVVDQVARATTQLAGQLSHAVAQRFQPAASMPGGVKAASGSSEVSLATAPGESSSTTNNLAAASMPKQLLASAPSDGSSMIQEGSAAPSLSSTAAAGAAAGTAMFQGMVPAGSLASQQQHQQQQEQQQPSADPAVLRLLLQQQADIATLKQQNKQLRAALCRLDPKAAVCVRVGGGGSGGRGSRGKGVDDVWSD